MFSVGFCHHFSKIFRVIFLLHWTHHLFTLDVAVMWPFQAKYTVTQNDWMMTNPEKKRGVHDLTNIISCASSVSFIMRNVLVGFENPDIWPFVRNTCIDENFKASSVVCGGNNEPCVLTARSVGLETSKLLHPSYTEVGVGWRENQELWLWYLRINVFRILVPRANQVGLAIPNLGRSQNAYYKTILTDSEMSNSDFTTHETEKFTE